LFYYPIFWIKHLIAAEAAVVTTTWLTLVLSTEAYSVVAELKELSKVCTITSKVFKLWLKVCVVPEPLVPAKEVALLT
jgi:hypothetical protein